MIPETTEVRFEVVTHCNYNCVMCPRDEFSRKKEIMNFQLFSYLLDKIVENQSFTTITFSGFGEPLIDNELEKKIRYAKSFGFKVLLLTNASLLTVDRFSMLKKAGLDSIRISLYGTDSENYLNTMKPKKVTENLFDDLMKNLDKIVIQKDNVEIILTYNIIPGLNDNNVKTWIDYWSNKVDLLEVWNPHNWVSTYKYREGDSKKINTCGRPWNTPIQVQVDGTINMCCFDYNGELELGDYKTQTLEEIYDSAEFAKIKIAHTTGEHMDELICYKCDQRNASHDNEAMVYSSRDSIHERVRRVSTTYDAIT